MYAWKYNNTPIKASAMKDPRKISCCVVMYW